MVSSVREALLELKGKFVASKYKEDSSLLKQRWKEQGNNIYFWLQTFDNLFIQTKPETRDDLLFYVKYDSKNKKEIIAVLRRDASTLPDHTDSTVFWDQTLYLNILLHEFEYHLTCCILNQKTASETLQDRIRTQVTMQVYPSTTERRMDRKSRKSEDSYPNLMFYVDNYEQVFHEVILHSPGEKVAVQIIATNPVFSLRRLIFVGGLDFSVLKNAVKRKEKDSSSFTKSILTKKKSYSEFQDDFHFVQMKGPYEKGHAQMAVRLTNNDDKSEEKAHSKDEEGEDPITQHHQKVEITTPSDDSQPVQTSKPHLQGAVGDNSTSSAVNTTSLNYLLPNPSSSGDYRTSPSVDSICSTNSNEPLCPSSQLCEEPGDRTVVKDRTKKKVNAEQQENNDGAQQKHFKGPRRHSSKKKSVDNFNVHAYLTFIQLPWYTVAEDIFKGTTEPLF